MAQTTICNNCGKIFSITNDVIKTECVNAEKKIERRFFQCPRCGYKYTILITDQPMRDKINQRRAINIQIEKLAKKQQIGKMRKLAEQDEDLKNEIWERGQQLKAEYEKGSFTE